MKDRLKDICGYKVAFATENNCIFLADKIYERHEILSQSIGFFQDEMDSVNNINILYIVAIVVVPVLTLIEVILYIIYQRKVLKHRKLIY